VSRLQARRALWLLGLVLVVGLGVERALTLARAAPTDFDDAYMYLRYAKHVLAGQGVSWNPGEGGVYGATSLLHLGTVVVAMVFFPNLSAAGTLQVASSAAALALLAGLIALAALVCRDRRLRGRGILWAMVLIPLVAFRDSFAFHAGTGMDTMLIGFSQHGGGVGDGAFGASAEHPSGVVERNRVPGRSPRSSRQRSVRDSLPGVGAASAGTLSAAKCCRDLRCASDGWPGDAWSLPPGSCSARPCRFRSSPNSPATTATLPASIRGIRICS
jgi:uncharacterized membrane protein YhaH (DUF805 family)